MESSWRMREARMLSRERRSDLSVCVPLDPALEEEAVAAEQAVPDRRARCSGKEEAGPDADDPAAPVAVPREHDRREARRRETGTGRDAAGVAAA
jgi:hypothetical protein